jgi:hypothetical protein
MRQPAEAVAPDVQPLAAADPMACDAAATLASRTSIGAETSGADGKAAIVLSLLGIMFTVLARFGDALSSILRYGVTQTGVVRITCAVLLIGFAASALLAVLQAFRTIVPRFRRDKPSLAFFGEIASMPREEYVARVESLTMNEAVDQILLYNHTAATICAEKFKQLDRSLRCFEAASACWLVLVLILVFKSLHG